MAEARETACDVNAEGGEVHLEGPGGVVLSMTSAAAEETAERLHEGAMHAAGQLTMKRWKEEEERSIRRA